MTVERQTELPLEFVNPLEIRIKGHRIGLEHVVERYREGYSTLQIAQDFPGLGEEKIDSIIHYYLSHRSDVEAYLERLDAFVAQQMQSDEEEDHPLVVKRLRALRAERQRARPA